MKIFNECNLFFSWSALLLKVHFYSRNIWLQHNDIWLQHNDIFSTRILLAFGRTLCHKLSKIHRTELQFPFWGPHKMDWQTVRRPTSQKLAPLQHVPLFSPTVHFQLKIRIILEITYKTVWVFYLHIFYTGYPRRYAPDFERMFLMLTLRWLMSYIYGAPILDVSRIHTTTQHIR